MAQDIKKLFQDQNEPKQQMPLGHEQRFLKKLGNQLPVKQSKKYFGVYRIAAGLVVFLGLAFGVYQFVQHPQEIVAQQDAIVTLKSLGDISPDLKKVEDYYMANINLELSKVKLTKDNKEIFDGYVTQLEELNKEYHRLTIELTQNGPNELTVSALIDNLKWRLNLLHRLKEQLNQLNKTEEILQENI